MTILNVLTPNFRGGVNGPIRAKSADKIEDLLPYPNAGSHNSIYRGKQLCPTGQGPTAAQYNAIDNGSFEDLYIGDYWTLGGFNWRIMALDYYLRCGENFDLQTHHALIVPDTPLYNHKMNDIATTDGGYVGSKMYISGLNEAKKMIGTSDTTGGARYFAGHVIKHKKLFTNTVVNSKPTNGSWYDAEVYLMNEQMVYGSRIHAPASDGITINYDFRTAKSQLPGFVYRPDLISNRQWVWLLDVVSGERFANVGIGGEACCYSASSVFGVRPAFIIGGAAA